MNKDISVIEQIIALSMGAFVIGAFVGVRYWYVRFLIMQFYYCDVVD